MDYQKIINSLKDELKEVELMAVSKTRSLEEIMAVYECGVKLFGENHVQEIVQKFTQIRPQDMKVHMIGHLQSNKVGKVVPLVDMIESIDSLSLLEKVDRASQQTQKTMDVLLELNTSGEESKTGFATEEELVECLEKAQEMKNVKVRGLMTVGPVNGDTEKAFKQLKNLYDKLKDRYGFTVLSMGMSQDYKVGVKNGSTQVRIGTKIFGERNYG